MEDINSKHAVYLIYEGYKNGNYIPTAYEIGVHSLKGDGDFRSKECIELLKEENIVKRQRSVAFLYFDRCREKGYNEKQSLYNYQLFFKREK